MISLRFALLVSVLSSFILSLHASAQQFDQAAPPKTSVERLAYAVRNAPATSLATALSEFYEGENVSVTVEATSNLLLIRAEAKQMKEVLALLEKIDRAPKVIDIYLQVLRRGKKAEGDIALPTESDELTKRIGELEKQGSLYTVNRVRLQAIENQKAFVQVGEQAAVETGRSSASFGGRSVRNMQYHSVGMIVNATARVNGDGQILMDFQFEKSDVQPAPPSEKDADGNDVPAPPSIGSTSTNSTLRLTNGEPMLVAGAAESSDTARKQFLLIVTARVRE